MSPSRSFHRQKTYEEIDSEVDERDDPDGLGTISSQISDVIG